MDANAERGRGAASRVLVIDDSASERAEIRRVLEAAGLFESVLEARDGLEGLRLLLAESPDAVICDLEMPGLDGEKLLRMRPARGPLPFLFLTGTSDEARRARLLEEGASDTIKKPFHPADLVARLQLHMKLARLERELREKNELLRRLSSTDSLTGLYNRRYVSDVLAIEFQKAVRYGTPLSVVMVDLDHFKRLNDVHGHLVGDMALVAFADVMREVCRQTDVAGRFGGEEFILVLPHTDIEGARNFAERLRSRVLGIRLEIEGDLPIRLSASFGVASHVPEQTRAEDLLAAADEALYRAKERGRDRVEV